MDVLIRYFKKNKGYARLKELKTAGIHTRTIAGAVANGLIAVVKPGLYKLLSYDWREYSGLVDVCLANPRLVICLISALEFHKLTTQNPSVVYAAIPYKSRNVRIFYPPVGLSYFSGKTYSAGIISVKVPNGTIKIYDAEKTICDVFRFRNKIGEDIAVESLKNYIRSGNYDIDKLVEYSAICRIKKAIMPYISALLEQ